MDGYPDEHVVRDVVAASEAGPSGAGVEADHELLRHVLDISLVQGLEELVGDFLRDRHWRRHRAEHPDLHGFPDTPFREMVVKQQRRFEGRRGALEGLAEDGDEHLARAVDVLGVPQDRLGQAPVPHERSIPAVRITKV